MKNFLNINSIESFSTKDGPGTRAVVFLQGCPLRCFYCHNIETWQADAGEVVETSELVQKLLRYKAYFGSDGGVTISGGEPLMQAKNLLPLLAELKKENVHISLDTAGCFLDDNVREVLKMTDLVILDVKFASEADYKKYTNGSLAKTIAFLDECGRQNKRTWVRIVVVPGINDSKKCMGEYIKLFPKKEKGYIEKIELLPFHTLGFSKYEKLAKENPLLSTKPLSLQKLTQLQTFVDKLY